MRVESEPEPAWYQRLRDLPWPWRIGLGMPLLLGVVLASGAAVSWLTGSEYRPPEQLVAGRIDEFELNAPKLFEDERIWVVRLDQEFIALYDRGTASGCTVPWRPELEFMGRKGWFRDACDGSLFDVSGKCLDGPCQADLARFAVRTSDGGEVVVDLRQLHAGPARSE